MSRSGISPTLRSNRALARSMLGGGLADENFTAAGEILVRAAVF